MNLRTSLENAPILDKAGYPYIIHPLTDGVPRVEPALLREWVAWARRQPALAQATVLLAPEAMALPLAAALSLAIDTPYVVGRKRSYGLPGEEVARCETGYSDARIHINDISSADRVVVIEDMISTGGTVASLLAALASMEVPVLAVLAAVEKGDGAAALRQSGATIEAMHRIDVVGNRVVVA